MANQTHSGWLPPIAVDVWLPVYNASATLGCALESLLRQTHYVMRIIAVDDGSDDGSADILDAFAARDWRMSVTHLAHAGLVPALRACAERSDAAFVARADADDVYLKRRLELQLARAQADDRPALVGTGVRQFPSAMIGGGMRAYTSWVNALGAAGHLYRDRLIECPIVHSTFLFRRDVYDRVGGYRDTDGPEDFDLLLRFVEAGETLASVPDVVTLWRLHEDSLQKRDPRYSTEAFLQTKLDHLRRLGIIDGRAVVIWGQTYAGKWLAEQLQAAGTEVAGFIELDRRKIGQRPFGILVADARDYVPAADALHINMVRHLDARVFFREALCRAGLQEWQNFVVMQ